MKRTKTTRDKFDAEPPRSRHNGMVKYMKKGDELKFAPKDEEESVSEFNQLADVENPTGTGHSESLGMHRWINGLTAKSVTAENPPGYAEFVNQPEREEHHAGVVKDHDVTNLKARRTLSHDLFAVPNCEEVEANNAKGWHWTGHHGPIGYSRISLGKHTIVSQFDLVQ